MRLYPKAQGLLALLIPSIACAHSFGVVYSLPIPFWLYAWGAGSALIASFVVIALVAGRRAPLALTKTQAAPRRFAIPLSLARLLQASSLFGLALCIASGWWGSPNPYANFNMTAFWIIFLLGFAYLTVLIGNLYALINPWRLIGAGLGRIWPRFTAGLLKRPERFGYLPATLLYLGLIWIELLGGIGPQGLSTVLAAYTVLNIAGCIVFGSTAWFAYGECFSVMFSLLAQMAPVKFEEAPADKGTRSFSLRWPLIGILGHSPPPSLLFFILTMLACTAFDGLHETENWHRIYWLWLYPEYLADYFGSNPFLAFAKLRELYQWWQASWLTLAPLIYLCAYGGAILLMKKLQDPAEGFWPHCGRFAYSLLPIVLVYHLSHYFTLLRTQGPKIIPLMSDPFGRGHNWLGTAKFFERVNIPDVTWVWNVQVFLIVAGHIVSVYAAHIEALRLYGDKHRAMLSQLPMLALMLVFTVGGLWILSQPFQGAR